MWNFLPFRSAVLFVLVASTVMARGRDINVRRAYVFSRPDERADQLFVTPDVVTVLRFQQPCDAAGTKMLAWEGRFEPVVCAGKSVVVVPLKALEPEDRFLLVVTLADGTEVPFTLLAAGRDETRWPDQQVNVLLEPDSRESLQEQLKQTREREQWLEAENRRHFKEDTEDYALAKLLSAGDIKHTSFIERRKRLVKTEDGAEMLVHILAGQGKAAVLLNVTNRHPSKPWSLLEARLQTTRPGEVPREPFLFGEARPFSLRMDKSEIAPGQSGNVAVVIDRSAFQVGDRLLNTLALELYRADGMLDAFVLLDRQLVRE